MALMFIESLTLTNIANAIRGKTGKTDTITPGNMPTEIESIPSGGSSTKLTINHSGDYSLKVYSRPFDGTTYVQTTVGYSDVTELELNDGWFVTILANDALYMCAQTEKGVDSSIRYSGSTMSGTNCTVKHVYNIQ